MKLPKLRTNTRRQFSNLTLFGFLVELIPIMTLYIYPSMAYICGQVLVNLYLQWSCNLFDVIHTFRIQSMALLKIFQWLLDLSFMPKYDSLNVIGVLVHSVTFAEFFFNQYTANSKFTAAVVKMNQPVSILQSNYFRSWNWNRSIRILR